MSLADHGFECPDCGSTEATTTDAAGYQTCDGAFGGCNWTADEPTPSGGDERPASAETDAAERIRELEAQVAALEAARMPHVPEDVDPVIRALVTERLRLGMSQRDVVHAIDCSSASVSQWERGITSPTLAKLRAWAESLGMGLDVRVTPPAGGAR